MYLAEWFKAYFGNVDFKVSHVEHFTYEDVLRYTGQRFYNERKHKAFYLAVKEHFENDCRYNGVPYGDHVFGEARNSFSALSHSFRTCGSFNRKDGNPEAMMAALNYIREYPESEQGFILADKLMSLVWLQADGWIAYINQYSLGTVGVYINRLFVSISKLFTDDTQYFKLQNDINELMEQQIANPLLPQMLHAAFAPAKEFDLKGLQNAKC